MLTKNFWSLASQLLGRYNNSSKSVVLTNTSGGTASETPYSSTAKPYTVLGSVCLPKVTNYGNSHGVFYGRGRTPATMDDYTMEDPILDGSITTSEGGPGALTVALNEDHLRISGVHQLTNNTAEDIYIWEVGLHILFATGGKAYMLEHTVLEEPIVVPAGNTISTEYVIKFPYGT
jgi:hypothetical protein